MDSFITDPTKLVSPFGSNNGRDWLVYPGQNADNVINELISLHEYSHRELNEITSIGFSLFSLSVLSEYAAVKNRKAYKESYLRLKEQSELVHEVYATWYSTTRFKSYAGDDTVELLLENNPEYRLYYQIGNSLIEKIKSVYLSTACMLAIARTCLESKEVGNTFTNHFNHFPFNTVRSNEFPDKRFQQIAEDFNSDVFIKLFEKYIKQSTDTKEIEFLKNELYGSALKPKEYLYDENTIDDDKLNKFIQKHIIQYFRAKKSLSFTEKQFDKFRNYWIKKINNECSEYKIKINPDPYNAERNMFIRYEQETILFRKEKLQCELIFVNDNQDFLIQFETLIKKNSETQIFSRKSEGLNDQYSFINSSDLDWLNEHAQTILYIPFIIDTNLLQILIVRSFDELEYLLSRIQDTKLCGCIFLSSFSHPDWWPTWSDFFQDRCDNFYFFNDISLLYYAQSYFNDLTDIKYCRIVTNMDGKSYTVFFIEFRDENNDLRKLITLGSDSFYSVASWYIDKNFKNFILDESLTNLYKDEVNNILQKISLEYNHYFNSNSIDYFS